MEIDYKKIGMKSGLEIHQQLDTGKLFSRTPSLLRKDKPDYEISRRLHKVAGEEGEVDEAVQHEAALNKEFIYQGYNDSISLVELDESPPREIDKEALDEVLKIALLLNCEIYSISQVMRKTVIDGSNTSGFQRTVLIGHDGYLETSFGRVGIETVALEEDSARTVEKSEKKKVYRLDRLGIPLVEIVTSPDMNKPEQVKEAALKIGEILRACKVKRGIGTIRQDVNVSSKGHSRVEIKGFQDPKMMVKTIDLELARQQKDKNGKSEVRRALESGKTEFMRPMPGRARMYPETDLPLLRISRQKVNEIKKHLPRLKGDIRKELKRTGLSDELMNLVLQGNVDEFNVLMKISKDANLVGKMVSLWRTDVKKLTERVLEEILEAVNAGKIGKEDVKSVMDDIINGKTLKEAIELEKAGHDVVEEKIMKIVKEKPGLRENAYMGLVMKEFKGKIDAKRAMEAIKKILG